MPSERSEKIKVYLLIVLALSATVLAYFRFIHKKNDMGVNITGRHLDEIKSDIQQPAKTEGKMIHQVPRLPPYNALSGEIRDIFSPVKLEIKPTPPVQPEQAGRPADIAKQKPAPAVTLELKGTILGDKKAMAIINKKFVQTGEKIGDYEVVRITPNTVYLIRGSHQKVIKVLTPAGN